MPCRQCDAGCCKYGMPWRAWHAAHNGCCSVRFAACVDRMRGSFVVTEFCEEGSLYSVLEGADLTAATQLDWTIQLAKGMNYLHFEVCTVPCGQISRVARTCAPWSSVRSSFFYTTCTRC
jgi:hypothetical protein